VAGGGQVEAKLRKGDVTQRVNRWWHTDSIDDIIAYRVIKEAPPPDSKLACRDPANTKALDAAYAAVNAARPKAAPRALDRQVAGDHYKKMKIQPVEFIHANGIPFIEGCIIKYAARWRDKGGVKDLEKIKHFADLLIELESRA